MGNECKSVSNTSPVYVLTVGQQQGASNRALLESRKDGKRVNANGSPVLVVANLRLRIFRGLPVTRVIHGGIGSKSIASLGGNNVSKEDRT